VAVESTGQTLPAYAPSNKQSSREARFAYRHEVSFMNWVRAGCAVLLGTLVVSSTACENSGSALTAPTAPIGPSLFAAQFSGNWAGTAVLTKVNPVVGGECVQDALQGQVGTAAGTDNVTMTVTQDAQNLTARLSSASTGLSCSYKGTAALNALALDAASCDTPKLLLRCEDGNVRELQLLGSTLQGTMTGGHINGTMANSYNAFDSETGKGVTRVTLNYQFTAARP
jgi:hypothetical protein